MSKFQKTYQIRNLPNMDTNEWISKKELYKLLDKLTWHNTGTYNHIPIPEKNGEQTRIIDVDELKDEIEKG